jgi:hypothetical protein
MTTTENTERAQSLRALAAEHARRSQESFDRSDTDGFLSQWASDLTARQYRLAADLAEAGDRAEFPALFDLDGNLVAAKLITTRYGTAWALLESDDPNSRFIGWVNRSYAQKAATRNANMARKGYSEGTVLAPAKADIMGSGTGLSGAASAYVGVKRTDGGFSRDVEVVRTTEVGDF